MKSKLFALFILFFTLGMTGLCQTDVFKTAQAQTQELRSLLIVPSIDHNSNFYLHVINPLDGLGYNYDVIDDDNILNTNLSAYPQIIVAGHSMETLEINSTEATKIIEALKSGSDLFWIGSGIWQIPDLPGNFGINYLVYNPAANDNITKVQWQNLAASETRSPIYNEYIVKTELRGASAEGYFINSAGQKAFPAITSYKKSDQGKAVYIGFDIFGFWKATDDALTWDRVELYVKYLQNTTSGGNVTLHPYPDAKSAAFLVRFEDVTPAGTMMNQNDPDWVERFQKTVDYLAAKGIPSNLALISVYADPYRRETHYWDETDWNGNIRAVVERALATNGKIIAHGFTHQNGSGPDDYSGDDNEMYNEDTKKWLTLAEQQTKTNAAYSTIQAQFQVTAKTWETPHYVSNLDTYTAAANSGFKYVSESDTTIFPNTHGYSNMLQDRLLMIPETAFNFPEDPPSDFVNFNLEGILPRIERINGNYFIFYHNNDDGQYNALKQIIDAAATKNYWFPNIEEYGDYTTNLRKATLQAAVSNQGMTAQVSGPNNIDGLTLKFRLPDGKNAVSVKKDGQPIAYQSQTVDGINYVLASFNLTGSANLEVNFENQPPQITGFSPQSDPTIKENSSETFSVSATDPDNDILNYQWFINGQPINGANKDQFTFQADFYSSGDYQLKVEVSDGSLKTDHQWLIHVEEVPIFNDVPLGFWAYWEIEAIFKAGITKGTTATRYEPGTIVSRDQIAVFIARALYGGDDNVPAGPVNPSFPDIPTDFWAYKHIEYIKNAGITKGFSDGLYHPKDPVNRDQMVVFLVRATGNEPENPSDPSSWPYKKDDKSTWAHEFKDVPLDYWAWYYIQRAYELDITRGVTSEEFKPTTEVDRAQMAVFLWRAFLR